VDVYEHVPERRNSAGEKFVEDPTVDVVDRRRGPKCANDWLSFDLWGRSAVV
jgi:hypothetical protein